MKPYASYKLRLVPGDTTETGNLDLGSNKMLEWKRFQTLEGDRDRK